MGEARELKQSLFSDGGKGRKKAHSGFFGSRKAEGKMVGGT